jgi:hypothetical protein
MRDDNNSRNQRPADQYRRAPAGAGNAQGGDPLAELARLIGQNDPFSDFGREQGRAAPAPMPDQRYSDQLHPDQRYSEPAPADWHPHPDPHRGAPQTRPAPQSQYAHPEAQPTYRGPAEPFNEADPFRGAPVAPDAQYAPQDFAQPGQAPGYDYGKPQQYADPRYAPAYGDPHGYPPAQGQQGYGSDQYYRGMPQDEDMYEDRPRARRRGGMLTVMAVLTLAVVGTAAAFGYRAIFSGSGTVLTPPTIRADAGPNKVAPAAQSADASGKLIYDRVGEKGQAERMISREEQPVDLKNATPPPRVVLSSGMPNPIAPVPNSPIPPSAPAFAAPPAAAAAPVATASAAAANASTEPKKVRTLTIRPDQPVVSPETASAPAAAIRQAAAPAEQAAPATTRVRTTTIRPQAAQGDPNAPLSLAPGSGAQQRAAPTRTASAPAARPVATATSDSPYAVQVTSQRSEAEAQSSFQALQAKYPNVLGSRQAMIRRADLGEKGTYYRAQVPFGSQGEASEFCASLKAAGGQCVVQRN